VRRLRFEQVDDTTWVDATYGWTIVPHDHEHWVWALLAPDTDDRVAYGKTVAQAIAKATRLQELKPVE
jgi:hypothetical protein